MLTLLPIDPANAGELLASLRTDILMMQPRHAWSDEGLERWGMVLDLAFPPLPAVGVRFDVGQQAWRGAWVDVAGEPALWCQERAPKDQLRPWVLVPLNPVHTPMTFWGAWLDHLAASFSRLPVNQARKACPQAELAGRLSGPAWALLSGRGQAGTMMLSEDLRSPNRHES